MKFYYVRNQVTKDLAECVPWEFVSPVAPSDKVRHDKQERQYWYRNPGTDWNFYTAVEPTNPNIRVSNENPPRFIHGFVADYDTRIPDNRIDEAIAALKIKPSKVEKSLGGNCRLVWLCARPLAVDTVEFATYVLQAARKWLDLDILPALDSSAFEDPARTYCNGAEWRDTGHGPVPENSLQAFFVKCGRDYNFKGGEANEIPLEDIEKEIKRQFPHFDWPGTFQNDSQGPSFWIPDSVSPLSAMVKPAGMFTFAAHAAKPFYSWADILGVDFVKTYGDNSLAAATADIYWDGRNFWMLKSGVYAGLNQAEMLNYFETRCGMKPTSKKCKEALRHIYDANYISGAAPFVFRPTGLIKFMGKPTLNVYMNQPLQPSEEVSTWGTEGKFPFLSYWLDSLFEPAHQKDHFLAWFKAFYESALKSMPMPGQNIFLMGGPGTGKTLLSRKVIALAVGGFSDASDYLVRGASFNSHLLEYPVWAVDDDTVGDNPQAQTHFAAALKKIAANQQHSYNKKFCVATMVEWMGRGIITSNMDYISSRILGQTDNTSLDKTNIFRCSSVSRITFPSRYELEKIIERELPYLLAWLLQWNPPEEVKRDVRYGYAAYHEPSLLEQSHQTSRSATFKEVLIEELRNYFTQNPNDTEWRGNVAQLFRLLCCNPFNDTIVRAWKPEQVNRYMEQIQREGLLKCATESGELKTRLWVFYRPDMGPPATLTPQIVAPPQAPPTSSIFQKV